MYTFLLALYVMVSQIRVQTSDEVEQHEMMHGLDQRLAPA
jgi:hypothetical protein